MPQLLGVGNRISQPIYDTVQVAAAAGPRTFSFFTTPLNGVLAGAVNKTLAETNVRQQGKLESGITFDIQGISLFVKEEIAAGTRPVFVDYQELNTGHFQLQFGTRTFIELPIASIPEAGAGLVYFSNITPAATEFHVNRGISAIHNRFPLPEGIKIEDNENFSVALTILGTTTVIMNITVMLWGSMVRPVN